MVNLSSLHWFVVESSIQEFERYHDLIEQFLNEEKQRLEDSFNKMESELKKNKDDDDYYNHMIDVYSEKFGEISTLFPHNFRSSFLIQIISFVEFHLKKICDNSARTQKQPFVMSDLKGNSDFEKAKVYLKKVADLDISKLGEDWEFIDGCRIIRNKLVHQQGLMGKNDDNKKSIEKFAKKQGLITVAEKTNDCESRIEINDKELNAKLISSVSGFFKELLGK